MAMITKPAMYTVAILFVLTVCLAGQMDATSQFAPASQKCSSNENKYNKESNTKLSDEEMFKSGHLKPFGSHRPPSFYPQEMPFMISPEHFYMNFVIHHKPIIFRSKLQFIKFVI